MPSPAYQRQRPVLLKRSTKQTGDFKTPRDGGGPPLCLDLYCGLGGWAHGFIKAGWDVIGIDINDFSEHYPGTFIQADLLTWDGYRELNPRIVVASPPCEQFSRHSMPWTRARNPPQPDLRFWQRSIEIAQDLKASIIIENVKGAQEWFGRSPANCGPFHLWGSVPAILPVYQGQPKQSLSGRQRSARAMIPLELSYHIARCNL